MSTDAACNLFLIGLTSIYRDVPTEVWNISNGDNKIIQPTLPKNKYAYGIGLYLVDSDFCQKH